MTQAIRGDLLIQIIEGRNLKDTDISILYRNDTDPYVEVFVADISLPILVTESIADSLNPSWNSQALIPLCYDSNKLKFVVWDSDVLRNRRLGEAIMILEPVNEPWSVEKWIELSEKAGEILINLTFEPFDPMAKIHENPYLDENLLYFPYRRGGDLTLYQDAHAPPVNVFEDIEDVLQKAESCIYIAGWSVWTKLLLKREESGSETLGELLIRKATQGVKVLVLIWSDKYSAKLCKELFGVHGIETAQYFEHSDVVVASVRRMPFTMRGYLENLIQSTYTHHMKLVIADSPKYGYVSFIGGLDLTDGRWDTPDHNLWSTLRNEHKGDFYNGFASVTEETGPREPWHDVHAKVRGEAAIDLLKTFEERWIRQAPQFKHWLVNVPEEKIKALDSLQRKEVDWISQILRSSDSDSSMFDRTRGLSSKHTKLMDGSVQHGLIALIRSVKKFLYIENQYFIGSSFSWKSKSDICADNLVPLEIAQQICTSIRNGSPIRVYVLIPMCPEGDPKSRIGSCYMSQILHWQFLTFQMMYQRIADTLKEVENDTHPEDYLLIMCLGTKLSQQRAARSFPMDGADIKQGSEAAEWRRKSRFLIYVHSKMAIADDARIVIGSANINQRSLDAERDTEVAISASQIKFKDSASKEGTSVSDGEVSKFRKRLWGEHTGGLSDEDELLMDPSSERCIQHLRLLAQNSLETYMSDNIDKDLTFRFIRYPLIVGRNGAVSAHPDMPTIPDLGLLVEGKDGFIPSNITT